MFESEKERMLFERVANTKEGEALTLAEEEKMDFNRMVHCIMSHQEEGLPHFSALSSKLKSSKSVDHPPIPPIF